MSRREWGIGEMRGARQELFFESPQDFCAARAGLDRCRAARRPRLHRLARAGSRSRWRRGAGGLRVFLKTVAAQAPPVRWVGSFVNDDRRTLRHFAGHARRDRDRRTRGGAWRRQIGFNQTKNRRPFRSGGFADFGWRGVSGVRGSVRGLGGHDLHGRGRGRAIARSIRRRRRWLRGLRALRRLLRCGLSSRLCG